MISTENRAMLKAMREILSDNRTGYSPDRATLKVSENKGMFALVLCSLALLPTTVVLDWPFAIVIAIQAVAFVSVLVGCGVLLVRLARVHVAKQDAR